MVQVSNCCFRATVSAKLMMYLIFSESPSFPFLPFVKWSVFQVGKNTLRAEICTGKHQNLHG